ncbi:MAG: M3 family metallopeptidase, partial [Gemmatimonadota bacterium]|nr:M3 family metallopeptidase [Gemmatimonadota bacterium]
MNQESTKMDWDLTPYFPTFNGPEMIIFKDALNKDSETLTEKAHGLEALNGNNRVEWESIFLSYEDTGSRLRHLASYISCLTAADARNEAYNAETASLNVMLAERTKLGVELLRALKDTSDEVYASFRNCPALDGGGFTLDKMREEARLTMAPELEVLAADLGVNGIEAWGVLYDNLSGQLEFDMTYPDGTKENLSMSQRRSLMENSDSATRKAAFEGGNAAWATMETTAAAALNAISGTRLTLNKHRGVDHFLENALNQANISRITLDAMFEAIYAEIELPRNILRFKAKAMGTEGIAWYDLGAALELPDQEAVSWEQGKTMVKDTFSRAYPLLGDFLQSTYDRDWIDHAPRPGKRPGAFCTSTSVTNESRVYMTFNNTMGDVLTLAHEVGHAFHSYAMSDLRLMARSYPMTLAESASTFGEMILMKGLLDDPSFSDSSKAFLLNLETSHAATYLMDIPVRFEFEKAMHEERADGELSVSQLKELMVESQRKVFGDVL